MNRQSVGDRTMLARAPGSERIVRDARRSAVRLERRVRVDRGLVTLGSLLDVRLNEELTARHEHARQMIEQTVAEHEPLLVTLLPPRIRKMHERDRDHTI